MSELRDAIANELDRVRSETFNRTFDHQHDRHLVYADAILAALHDAGFVVAQLDDVAQTVWFYDHQWGDGVYERLSELIGDYDPRSSGEDQP